MGARPKYIIIISIIATYISKIPQRRRVNSEHAFCISALMKSAHRLLSLVKGDRSIINSIN